MADDKRLTTEDVIDELIKSPISRGDAPREPHLAFMSDWQTKELAALPVGTIMAVVLDPKSRGGIQYLILKSVGMNTLRFKCICGDKNCTVEWFYKARLVGRHHGKRYS